MGRWLSRDPIGEAEENLYAFVTNAPPGQIDLLGFQRVTVAFVGDSMHYVGPHLDDGLHFGKTENLAIAGKIFAAMKPWLASLGKGSP
jgi:hypothetical protein